MALADQDLGVWDGTDGVVLSHVIADTLGEGQETIAPRVHRPITTIMSIMYTSLMLSYLVPIPTDLIQPELLCL